MKTPLILISAIATLNLSAAETRPNIIYINIDDLGWGELGYTGSKLYESPNIDKLAEQSMVFTAGYAPSSNCAPSRAACQTGQWSPRTGVYTVLSSARGKSSQRKIIPIKNTLHITKDNLTIGGALKNAGYATASMGKWHVSKTPLDHGYDINIGGSSAGGPYTGGYFSPFKYPNLVVKEKGVSLTDRLTDHAIEFITQKRDNPFFLYLPYFSVHSPLQGDPELTAKFEKKAKQLGSKTNPKLVAMVAKLDANIGRLMKALDDHKLAENTIVIFTSDNGGVYKSNGEHPLRAGKGSYYEGGIREPFLIRWPAKIKPAKNATPVSGLDIFPTLIEAAKTTVPKDKILDGTSLIPELTGTGKIKDRPLFWHFPIYLQGGNKDCQDPAFRTRPGSAIRHGNWKLIQYFENGDLELYNLKNDPREQNNLAKSNPEKTQELLNKLKSWQKQTNAPIPTQLNPDFGKDNSKRKKKKKNKKKHQ